jgi:hypothetical protein
MIILQRQKTQTWSEENYSDDDSTIMNTTMHHLSSNTVSTREESDAISSVNMMTTPVESTQPTIPASQRISCPTCHEKYILPHMS